MRLTSPFLFQVPHVHLATVVQSMCDLSLDWPHSFAGDIFLAGTNIPAKLDVDNRSSRKVQFKLWTLL
jgi:hypothetical protein